MKLSKIIAVCVLIVFGMVKTGLAQDYRGIRPLNSTCEDVKRALGVSTCNAPNLSYEADGELVKISFSTVTCQKAWQKFWNVPPGTVMSIERFLKEPIPLSEMHINLDNYEKLYTDDINESVYASHADGLIVSVINGLVRRIVYTPTSKDDYLLCADQHEIRQARPKRVELPARWFDKYGNLPFNKEKERLDKLAGEMQVQGPNTAVYIVVYTPQHGRKDAAINRAVRAKNYLVKSYHISPQRIEPINGGKRDTLEVMLYIVTP